MAATSLLAARFFRRGDDIAAGLDGSVLSFSGGVALWSAGLLILSLSNS